MLTEAVYIKVIGGICVISGCTGTGLFISRSYRRRYYQLSMLRQMMMLLKGEIRYAGAELPEIFLHAADRVEAPFNDFLRRLSEDMRAMTGENLDALWKKNIRDCLGESFLTSEDKMSLMRLGTQLGFLDREMQLAAIELYQEELNAVLHTFEKVLWQKQKLSVSLGVLTGFFLTILLI